MNLCPSRFGMVCRCDICMDPENVVNWSVQTLYWYIPECDIRNFFDTNEYPNIFASKNLHKRISEYIRITSLTQTNVWMNIRIENCANIRIFKHILHSNTLTNEYPNIFVQSNLTWTNVRIYSYRKIDIRHILIYSVLYSPE